MHQTLRWAAGMVAVMILAALPGPALAQRARSELAGITIPHGGRAGGNEGAREARKALEKSVADRRQGETISRAESLVWGGEERPDNEKITRAVISALEKKGYSYEVLYDGREHSRTGEGAVYFQAVPEEKEKETLVGMWLNFGDDEYKLVWASLVSAQGGTGGREKQPGRVSALLPLEFPAGVTHLEDNAAAEAQELFAEFLERRAAGEKAISAELVAWIGADRPQETDEVIDQFRKTLREHGLNYRALPGPKNGPVQFEAVGQGRRFLGFWAADPNQLIFVWGEVKAPTVTDSADSRPSQEDLDLAEALYRKGLKALGDDREDEAERSFRKALELAPGHKGAAKALQALKEEEKQRRPQVPAGQRETTSSAAGTQAGDRNEAAAGALRRLLKTAQ